MTIPSPRSAQDPHALTGWHVLGMMLAFFAIVFTVNGVYVFDAISTHPGVVSEEPYRKGLHYNDRIAAAERQAATGWQDDLAANADGHLALSIRNASGVPVEGLVFTATIGRPSTEDFDRPVQFMAASGNYVADAGQLGSGTWLVTVEARQSAAQSEPIYRIRKRLWLKP
jgi:nitrogen fixation protein FixH